MRFRLLPLVILVAGLAMTAKLAGIWQDLGGSQPALAAETAAGETPVPAPAESGAPASSAPASSGEAEVETAEVPTDPVPPGQITDLSADVFDLTDEELGLLQSLSQRREELEQRAREVDEREVLLKAAEQRIEQKIRELEGLQESIEALLVEHDEQTESQMKSLVKIYESMKPKQAARIFEELDMEVLLEVIERMKERKSAPILAQMNPQRAKAVTLELAQRRELPIPRE